MTFYMATKNAGKLKEMCRIIEPMGYSVLCETDLSSPLDDIEETGTTFEENALLKAMSAYRQLKMPSVADDSGLCVDALDGAPGIYSARYSGEHGNDEKNMDKLLDAMKNVPTEKRTARFVSAIACVFSEDDYFVVRGTCEGSIAEKRIGTNGFGYDPVFITPYGAFGEMTDKEKDAVSHRHNSLAAFAEKLKERFDKNNVNE